MPNDDTSVHALIAGYKACDRPDATTQARIRRALAVAARDREFTRRRRVAVLPWLACAAALALLIAWRALAPSSSRPAAGGEAELSVFAAATTGPERAATTPTSTPRTPAPGIAAQPSASVAPPAERAPAGDGRRRKPAQRSGTADAGEAGERASETPGVLAEMALLRRAQEAQRADRPREALTLLDHHAAVYPDGSLAEERQALRVAALCAAGEVAQGRAARAAFLRDHPRSAYAGRVVAACGGSTDGSGAEQPISPEP